MFPNWPFFYHFWSFFANYINITLCFFDFLIYKYYPCLLPYSFFNCFILAFCVNWWMPYVGAGIALLDNTSTTLFRSLITKCVDPDEVGYGNTGYDVFKGVIQNQTVFLAKSQLKSNEIIEFCELVKWGGIKKCQNLTFKVNFLCQKSSESF